LPIFLRRGEGSRDHDDSEVNPAEVTSLADELRMLDDESCDDSMRLLPAQDSCEVDSLPEDRGKPGLLPSYELL